MTWGFTGPVRKVNGALIGWQGEPYRNLSFNQTFIGKGSSENDLTSRELEQLSLTKNGSTLFIF